MRFLINIYSITASVEFIRDTTVTVQAVESILKKYCSLLAKGNSPYQMARARVTVSL